MDGVALAHLFARYVGARLVPGRKGGNPGAEEIQLLFDFGGEALVGHLASRKNTSVA